MSKVKYTEEIKQEAIRLRLEGLSAPEITELTGMGKESQNKLFRERNIKMSPEAAAKARERRWLNHEPVQNGQKECSRCGKLLPVSEFSLDNNKISKLSSWCRSCGHDYYEENADHVKARVKEYRAKDPEAQSARDKDLYSRKPEEYVAKATRWRNENLERAREIHRAYDKRTQPSKNARTAMYRAQKLQASPPWLTEEHLNQIKVLYQNCPKGFHVDHIIPLNGDIVSGLHVPWNLQYLPAIENLKKSNKI